MAGRLGLIPSWEQVERRPKPVDEKFSRPVGSLLVVSAGASDHAYRITVVCLGNICRSPIGEAVLRSRVEQAGMGELVQVDSAGTGDWHLGLGADPRTLVTLDAHGYSHDHTARQITPDWFEETDLVLAMDVENYRDLSRMLSESGARTEVRMMRSFDPALAYLTEPHPDLSVPDPYYGGPAGFDQVLRMIEDASGGVVAHAAARLQSR